MTYISLTNNGIRVVESDPSKFGLTKQDVVSRRQFVETTREQIQVCNLCWSAMIIRINLTFSSYFIFVFQQIANALNVS